MTEEDTKTEVDTGRVAIETAKGREGSLAGLRIERTEGTGTEIENADGLEISFFLFILFVLFLFSNI